ncbi:MAG: hypothetical protein ACRCZA_10280 [Shewanella sp.]|uniref:hypothetical protein n=1 Tax=Shewanella sp. TaxID=50422 RepID=UPI003F3A4B43
MLKLNSLFVLVLVSALSATVSANEFFEEIVIDTSDLPASIGADLTQTMEQMQQEALASPTLLSTEDGALPPKHAANSAL